MKGLSYFPGNSALYRLHPVTKGGGVFLLILWFSLHRFGLAASGAGLAAVLVLGLWGGAPMGSGIRELRGIALLLAVVAVMNVTQGGEHPWLQAGDAVARITGVFLLSVLLVSVAAQSELMFFWECLFRPLSLFGVQPRELALVMVIAVRFLPVMMEEIERIRMAQAARGAGWGARRGILSRVRGLMPLLVPVLVLSIHRASDLALAMEARAYRLHTPRTRYQDFRFGLGDLLAGTLLIGTIMSLLLAR